MDNIAFAMDLNDQIPEHIRQEIVGEESLGRVQNKVNAGAPFTGSDFRYEYKSEPEPEAELETNLEYETGLESINDLNAGVSEKCGENMLKRFMQSAMFAMEIDDKIPEHVRQELIRKESVLGMISDGEINTGESFIRSEPSVELEPELESIDDLNAGVSEKRRVFNDEEAFFSEIIGYYDIKKLLLNCIQSSDREPIHVILDGPPASAKSMFLLQMQKKLADLYYVDCTNASGPGMVEYLFKNDVKYLLLDEVEKMSRSNQNVLLNVMETGMLTSTKSKEMNLSIYATTNDIDSISKPFRSRFLEFSLPQYTYEDFCEIAVKLLNVRYEHPEEISLKIADTVWNKIKSKDVRDILAIGKLSNSVDDVEFVADTLQKYKKGVNS
jgi:hypothetical protein